MNSDEKSSMKELEGWIEQLMECKQLSENQVLRDCSRFFFFKLRKIC